jgi:lipopolysaccharide export system protein LptC
MPWTQRLGERVLLYLPLIFMGSLALGTYWLVRTAPAVQDGTSAAVVAQGPDYYLQGFVMRSFDAQGQLRTEVTGDRATHFPDKKAIAIDNIRIKNVDSAGRVSTATARTGLTDDAQTQVELQGQARVVRDAYVDAKGLAQERAEYRSEYLLAHLNDEIVSSHQPVELLRSGGDRFTADTLYYDNGAHTLQLQGRVRGTLVPRSAPVSPPAAAKKP